MFAEIALTRGKLAKVDVADVVLVTRAIWMAAPHSDGRRWYATGRIDGKLTSMHRFLLAAQPGQLVDHRNGDGLDNRRDNLRLCTNSDNVINSDRRRNNRFRGVQETPAGTFVAAINVQGRRIYLGCFPTEVAAACAYDDAAEQHHGEFAVFNYPRYIVPVAGVGR